MFKGSQMVSFFCFLPGGKTCFSLIEAALLFPSLDLEYSHAETATLFPYSQTFPGVSLARKIVGAISGQC